MKRYIKLIIIISSISVCLIGLVGYHYYNLVLRGIIINDTEIKIPTGATFSNVVDSLRQTNSVVSIASFEKMAKLLSYDERVKPGRYILKKGMSYKGIVSKLRAGYQDGVRIVFHNVRTLDQLAGKITNNIELDSLTMVKALHNDSIQANYGVDSTNFIALFIPNTYEVYWDTTPEELIDRMYREYNIFWTPEREARLKEVDLSRDEVMTLASIVYEESKLSPEFSTIAGVYINRIRAGMPLQADPTVKFAVGDFSLRRILYKHLEVDSPYNTYKHRGLPPGPISMPSIKAIDGVLNYKEHNYYYFCAADDLSGYHKFARNLSEHNRNARAFHRAINKRKIWK